MWWAGNPRLRWRQPPSPQGPWGPVSGPASQFRLLASAASLPESGADQAPVRGSGLPVHQADVPWARVGKRRGAEGAEGAGAGRPSSPHRSYVSAGAAQARARVPGELSFFSEYTWQVKA